MKKSIYLFAASLFVLSCKSPETPLAASTTDTSVSLPYKASYSSAFVITGDQKNTRAVLQSYKDWENNKLTNAPAYFADTVTMIFPDGTTLKQGRDSMVHYFQKYRDSLSSSTIDMQAWISTKVSDKNDEWVSVWYKQTDVKGGKTDSSFYEDNNHLVNGKIDFVESYMRKIKK
jgi:ketosteroid isomerase-like protein